MHEALHRVWEIATGFQSVAEEFCSTLDRGGNTIFRTITILYLPFAIDIVSKSIMHLRSF